MKEYISICASRIADALKNNERVAAIERDTALILEAVASGQTVKITRTNTDPDLYDELDSLGVFANGNTFNKKEPTVTKKTTTKKYTPTTPVTPRRAVPQPEVPQAHIDFDSNKKFNLNDKRLRAMTQRLDEEDLDDDARMLLETECSKLIAEQRELTAQKTLGLKKGPPPQTPSYLLGKRKKRAESEAARKNTATDKFFNGRRPNLKLQNNDDDEESEQNRMPQEPEADDSNELGVPLLHDE